MFIDLVDYFNTRLCKPVNILLFFIDCLAITITVIIKFPSYLLTCKTKQSISIYTTSWNEFLMKFQMRPLEWSMIMAYYDLFYIILVIWLYRLNIIYYTKLNIISLAWCWIRRNKRSYKMYFFLRFLHRKFQNSNRKYISTKQSFSNSK